MELELGLALPPHVPIKDLDLNINSLEPKENFFGCGLEFFKNQKEKKRTFDEAFDDECISKAPSLLVWNGQKPNDGDDREGEKRRSFDTFFGNLNEEEDDQIVGWPPIKSWRKKLLHPQQIQRCGGIINGGEVAKRSGLGCCNTNGSRNSIYVKVKMEGVAIGRKIDLMLFNSYQSLVSTLITMFAKYAENDKDDEPYDYILSYLDKEGDWLLAGDVPWKIFIETVQRIEISKQVRSQKESKTSMEKCH